MPSLTSHEASMELAASLQNNGWRCDRDCLAGSTRVAVAVGKLGTNPGDLGVLQEAESTIIAFNNCGGPCVGDVLIDSENFSADLMCPLAQVAIETSEICERVQ